VLSTVATGSASTALQGDSQEGDQEGSDDGHLGTAMILAIPQDGLASFNLAREYGRLWYALRPRSGAQDTTPTIATPCSVLAPGLNFVQVKTYLGICLGGKNS
jgi:hypothetical protein